MPSEIAQRDGADPFVAPEASKSEGYLVPAAIYEALAEAPAAQRADIVLRLIEDHPQGRLVIPARDGLHAVLDEIDLSPQALQSRGGQFENALWWDPESRSINLRGADLEGASLRNADLRGASLLQVNLRAALLGNVNLQGANLDGSDLRQADLAGADLTGAALGKADLREAMLEEATLEGAVMRFAKLGGATLENSILRQADLWGTDVERAALTNADLEGANLQEANLRHADLSGANLQNASLNRADLRGAKLRDVKLQGVDLTHCDITHVHLSGARLDETLFERQQLGGAIGEELAGEFDRARRGYLVLERAFQDLGDHDAAVWAYGRRRRMQKWLTLEQGREARGQKQWGTALKCYTRFASDELVEWLCDYGESVPRVLASLLVLFLTFALIYGVTGSVVREVETPTGVVRVPTRAPTDLAIFGLLAMTTGSIGMRLLPAHDLALILVGLHLFLGVALVGLLGFVLGNRIRR
jgi:uncharacterized protein YjbI with pentapeptide repeats